MLKLHYQINLIQFDCIYTCTTHNYNSNFIVAPSKGKSNIDSIYVMMYFVLQIMNGIEKLNSNSYAFKQRYQCFYRHQNGWGLFIS